MAQAPLRPMREQFTERLIRCVAGLACFGTGIAFFVRSELGVPPWDVFHQGISKHTGLGLGTVLIIVAFFVLLLWIPLRLRPGLGTLLNAIEIGLVENVAQDLIPQTDNIAIRIAFMVAGLCIIAAGSGLYIGAEFGSGPRDGLMLGLNMRFGVSYNGGKWFEPAKYLTDYFTDEAVTAIKRNKNPPFFMYLAHWGVHTPLQASKADYDALPNIPEAPKTNILIFVTHF